LKRAVEGRCVARRRLVLGVASARSTHRDHERTEPAREDASCVQCPTHAARLPRR
jgi:hypothetical protein